MTAIEKAHDLINYFLDGGIYSKKQVALKTAIEIRNNCTYMSKNNCDTIEQLRASDEQFFDYWQEVIKELEKL